MGAAKGTARRRRGVVSVDPTELRQQLVRRKGFSPDRFQAEAFDVVERNHSVLVAAPTSSGKTLVAEYAISRALAMGRTVAYTTPIKALSNQKMRELSGWLGAERVGLLTGDNSVRADAPVVVMTTEVLRNMIYARSPFLEDLGVVVLDEVHYLQDQYRGPVWEEVIIQLPLSVQLVCLSATVSNASELAAWVSEVRGPCEPVVERDRPVELHNHYLLFEKGARRLREFRTVRDGHANPEVERYLAKAGGRGHPRDHRRRGVRPGRPRRLEVLRHLEERGRLPAIVFIFSRQGCDDAVRSCLEAGVTFLDGREQQRVEMIAEEHVAELSDDDLALLGYHDWLEGLRAGVAAHHAGMVAPFKEAVEDCFAAGLLQVVFATETLALGINMPARSVVIEQLTRFRGDGHVMLTPGEHTQLTGRAGRRGIDPVGHAYTLWSPYVSFEETARLVGSGDFELDSAFRPTYNMAANLMATRTRDEALELLQQSFAQFRADRRIVSWARKLESARSSLRQAEGELNRLGAAVRVPSSRGEVDTAEVVAALRRIRPGDVIAQPRQHGDQRILVIGTTSRKGGDQRLRVVTARGKTMMLSVPDFDRVPRVHDQLNLPKPYAPNRREFQRAAARALKAHLNDHGIANGGERPVESGQRRAVNAAERQANNSRASVVSLEERIRTAEGGLGRALDSIVDVLREFGLARGWKLTPSGERLRRIFHECDLLTALAIDEGLFDGLEAPELAGLASLLTYEHRSRLDPPPPWFPTEDLGARARRLQRLGDHLRLRERDHGLTETRVPDPTFFAGAYAWASGHPLDDVLTDDDLRVGDFVRNIRQLVDLVGQIADVTPDDDTRRAARQAITALDRGVIAAATRLSESDAERPLPEDSGDDRGHS
jgi:ATP-dependent RNA helicase HelY